MKKVALAVAVILGFVVVQPVQASNNKSLVIIDSYFQSTIAQNPITSVGTPCPQSKPITGASPTSPYNHGTAMYNAAKLQNPELKVISICAAASATAEVTPDNFIAALTWVNNNPNGIGAVSVSRFMNHATKTCMPPKLIKDTPESADKQIKQLISSLLSKGIPVFASTGNKSENKVDYPACITSTVSVGIGSLDSSGTLKRLYSYDSNTDYFASSPVINYSTSFATAAVASQYIKLGVLPSKVVTVLP